MVESRLRTVQLLRMGAFVAGMEEVVLIGYPVMHGFVVYNLPLDVEANSNAFLHMQSFYQKETLKQLQQIVQRTF